MCQNVTKTNFVRSENESSRPSLRYVTNTTKAVVSERGKAPVKVRDVPKAASKRPTHQTRPPTTRSGVLRRSSSSAPVAARSSNTTVSRRSSTTAISDPSKLAPAAATNIGNVTDHRTAAAHEDYAADHHNTAVHDNDVADLDAAAIHEESVADHSSTAVYEKDVADQVAAVIHEDIVADHLTAAVHDEDVADHVAPAIHAVSVADHSTAAAHDEDPPDHHTAPIHVEDIADHVSAAIHEENVADRLSAAVYDSDVTDHVAAAIPDETVADYLTAAVHDEDLPDHLIAIDSHSVKATDLDTKVVTRHASNHEEATNEVTRYVFQRRDSAGCCAGSNAGPGRHILTMTKQLIKKTLEVKVESCWDVDAQDRDNPLAETTYVADIYHHYKMTEKEGMVCSTYMSAQSEINSQIRGVVLDWVVQVHESFNLMPETLFLAVNIFDRYLAATHVPKEHIQLVGAACILIAAKYEEIYTPLVADFEYIGDGAYTRGQMLMMEKQILNKISFKLSIPTCYMFAARYLNFAKAAAEATTASDVASNGWSIEVSKGTSSRVHAFAWYLLELTIPEISMVQFSPSHLAAAAVYTALLGAYQKGKAAKSAGSESNQTIMHRRPTNEGEIWGSRMADLTGYEDQELWHCVGLLLELYKTALSSRHGAVYEKYQGKKFLEAATYPAPLSET
ncbi:unnamed protein product [Closterium sp. Yama58-4]|nr:unnamed protein product [Closterium sp. Yama58-4]